MREQGSEYHTSGGAMSAALSRRGGRPSPTRRLHIPRLGALSALALLLLAVVWFSPVGVSGQASGKISNLQVSSDTPGDLTISWDTPAPAPSEYRVRWAVEGLGWLSYKKANEANRGNEYPAGDATSITLTGLTQGDVVEVQARSRYQSGGRNDGPWSGPWSDTVTPITGSSSERADGDLPADTTTTGQVAADAPALGAIVPSETWWDYDWFATDLVAGQSYVVKILGGEDRDHCTLLAPLLDGIYDSDGNLVPGTEWSHEDRAQWPSLAFTAPASGRHYVAVSGEGNWAGIGSYVLALTAGGDGSTGRIDSIGTKGCPRVEEEEPLSGAARSSHGVRNLTFSLPPARPASNFDQYIDLSWDVPQQPCALNASGTKIYAGTSSNSLAELVTVACTRTTYKVYSYTSSGSRVEPGATYYFRVDAVPTGSYAQSSVITVTTRSKYGPNVVVSNLNQTSSGTQTVSASNPALQSFTTGPNEFGYVLDRVILDVDLGNGRILDLKILDDSNGSAGDLVAHVGSFTGTETGVHTYIFISASVARCSWNAIQPTGSNSPSGGWKLDGHTALPWTWGARRGGVSEALMAAVLGHRHSP